MSEEEKKYLDEEDVLEDQPIEEPEEEPVKAEPEVEPEEKPGDKPVEGEPIKVEPEEKPIDWQELAKKEGWVPDHVREKHAREAQTLRDQNKILQRMLESEREPIDPNEVVRQGDLNEVLANIQRNMEAMRDPALISEMMLRSQVNDYDEVVINHVEPLAEQYPWLQGALREERNPAKAAYDLGCALRDGRRVGFGFKGGKMTFEIESERQPEFEPVKKDPSRPPVEALEQAKKQPKSLDEIPSASGVEAVEMSVEEFWKLPSDTLMRMRTEKPEVYIRMREKFNEKYG